MTARTSVHEVDDGLDGADRRLGEDAVAEVEDVTGLAAGLLEDARGVLLGELARREQDGRDRGCPGRRGRRRPSPSPSLRAACASRGR